MSVYDNDLVCICEIRPVIDNDILGDFVQFSQCPMATIFWSNDRGPG